MANDAKARRSANLATPTDLGENAAKDVAGGLNILLADVYALYIKTKNFHWHVSGPHFRDYHLLLDEQATQVLATTDPLAELREDNLQLTSAMRQVHNTCDEYHDVATASLLEVWIDEAERRTWFLFEATEAK